jgi:hypothetical protein
VKVAGTRLSGELINFGSGCKATTLNHTTRSRKAEINVNGLSTAVCLE